MVITEYIHATLTYMEFAPLLSHQSQKLNNIIFLIFLYHISLLKTLPIVQTSIILGKMIFLHEHHSVLGLIVTLESSGTLIITIFTIVVVKTVGNWPSFAKVNCHVHQHLYRDLHVFCLTMLFIMSPSNHATFSPTPIYKYVPTCHFPDLDINTQCLKSPCYLRRRSYHISIMPLTGK